MFLSFWFPSRLAQGDDLPSRTIRLGLALAVGLVWSFPWRALAQEGPASPPAAPSAEDMKRMADRAERAFRAMEKVARDLPRDTVEPGAVVEKTGKEPEKLLAWVRDQTYLVPYRGLLRGPMGVLMDRLGNSLDRALLLQRLLIVAGHEARLAQAHLDDLRASRLLDAARPVPPEGAIARAPVARKDLDRAIDAAALEHGLDAAFLRQEVARAEIGEQRLAEEVVGRSAAQAESILALLRDGPELKGRDPRMEREAARRAAVADLQDHWWVQVRTPQGWRDLDPAWPQGGPPSDFPKADRTVAQDKFDGELKDLVHEVVLRVVIERWSESKLEEVPVLEQPLWPCGLIGRRIAIDHVPLNWGQGPDLSVEKDPIAKLKEVALSEREWIPMLRVDSQRVAQHQFDASGQVTEVKNLPGYVKNVLAGQKLAEGLGEAAEALGGSVGKILSRGAVGKAGRERGGRTEAAPARPPAPPGSAVTAEWIEYEIRSPGREPRKVRREVFDLYGPARRAAVAPRTLDLSEAQRLERALSLLGQTEVLPLSCLISPEAVGLWTATKLLESRQAVLGILRSPSSESPRSLADRASGISPLPGHLFGLALVRHQLGRLRDGGYLASPNVLTYRTFLKTDPQGKLLLCHGFDIVANDMAVTPGVEEDPFRIRLEQGVLDTNAECLLMKACGRVENTSEAFTRSPGQGGEWLVLRGTADLAALELPADARARIERELAEGQVVIAPRKAVAMEGHPVAAWWRIDPRTGQTLGIGERGWGQTAVELMVQKARVVLSVVVGLICFVSVMESQMPNWAHYTGVVLCMVAGGMAGAGVRLGGFAGQVLALLSGLIGVIIWGGRRWL